MKLSDIKSLIKDFESSKLTELELETNTIKIKLSKNKNPIIKSLEPEKNLNVNPNDTNENNDDVFHIKSPLVGTFYENIKPGAGPLVKVGDKVKVGQILCIVEAMKIMNEITSPVTGTINKVPFKNGEVVGFDDILFEVVK